MNSAGMAGKGTGQAVGRSQTETRLAQLLAAVRASERMPTARRKAAHRAVGTDLDVLEQDLLKRLNVR